MLPEVRIKFGHFLEPTFEIHMRSQPDHSDWKSPSREDIIDKIESYKNAWKPYEPIILNGLVDSLELSFYQNVVDVFIVGGLRGGFSSPMVINSGIEPDRFIDVLSHELTHRLITDNTRKIDYAVISQSQFPSVNEKLVLNHIFVHAVHKKIYLDILKEPARLERDLKRCEKSTA